MYAYQSVFTLFLFGFMKENPGFSHSFPWLHKSPGSSSFNLSDDINYHP